MILSQLETDFDGVVCGWWAGWCGRRLQSKVAGCMREGQVLGGMVRLDITPVRTLAP